jgi:hypothetical protein
MIIKRWLSEHLKTVIPHSLILGFFLIFLFFISEPLFNLSQPSNAEESILQESIMLPEVTSNICYDVDRVSDDNRNITIIGWSFVRGINTDNNLIYLCLKSDFNTYVFDTFTIPRPDVTENYAYLNLNLDRSGFKTTIPFEDVSNGKYKLGLLIYHGDAQDFRWTYTNMVKSREVVTFPIWTATKQDVVLPEISNNLLYHIDLQDEIVMEGKGYLEIHGWAYVKTLTHFSTQTYVVLKSDRNVYMFNTQTKYSPWVSDYFHNLDLDWAGFKSIIPEEILEEGTYQIGIFQKGDIEALQYFDNAGNQHSLTIPRNQ